MTPPGDRGRDQTGTQPSAQDLRDAEIARMVARRAIRRLDILEWVIFALGAGLATAGGALIGWMLAGLAGWDFRSTWIGASLLLFVVPGSITVMRIRRDERNDGSSGDRQPENEDG